MSKDVHVTNTTWMKEFILDHSLHNALSVTTAGDHKYNLLFYGVDGRPKDTTCYRVANDFTAALSILSSLRISRSDRSFLTASGWPPEYN